MPHLYIHLRHDNEFVEDPEGGEYDSLDHARQDAMWAAREIMSDRIRQGKPADGSTFEIADEFGVVLLVYPFENAIWH